jgi:hypothetical protein
MVRTFRLCAFFFGSVFMRFRHHYRLTYRLRGVALSPFLEDEFSRFLASSFNVSKLRVFSAFADGNLALCLACSLDDNSNRYCLLKFILRWVC